ncbi:hypothetical protein DQ04_02281010 [Trypanosoma grayi]|uniref:hypothetical protein n=1 Tax=Trypanosoma grayi TaxID=71804 RepID=UPI0004F45113|nr:hypothetical protein DQ04_02281010 [Trypanosoma grayi]KEG11783.1 hypothetical protein DQ04_02281010 [Trypanosoma grayi]
MSVSFSPYCSPSTEGGTGESPIDANFAHIPTVEDRFIGIADYKEFLHNPLDGYMHSAASATEARYRRTLETQMGLGGSGGLMFFRGSDRASRLVGHDDHGSSEPLAIWSCTPSRAEDSAETSEHQGSQQQKQSIYMDSVMGPYGVREEPQTPPSSPVRSRLECRYPRVASHNGNGSSASSPKLMPVMHAKSLEGCHTPLPMPRAFTASTPDGRSPGATCDVHTTPGSRSLRGDALWTSPAATTAGLRTPVHGSRCNDVAGGYKSSPKPGGLTMLISAAPPQLCTPVRHENDLLSVSVRSAQTGNVGVSQNASPVPRRSALYSQHMTSRRPAETCDRVLNAEGISLCDAKGRPNFSPLCWGYLGAVIALHQGVYLWQGPDKVRTLIDGVQPHGLVSAVASSRHLTEGGDVYMAVGFINGLVVVNKYHVDGGASTGSSDQAIVNDSVFSQAMQTSFVDHSSHISTLQVMGHHLYIGCMDGILTVRNLRDKSVVWRLTECHEQIDSVFDPSDGTDCQVNVGAPIYKLEVTPDGQHIAVGTEDSLFLYQVNRLGPGSGTKRRVIFSGATRPVRAFSWWTFPSSPLCDPGANVHSSPNHANWSGFSQTMLLYAGDADGTVLSAYSVGGRCEKATCRLSAPILGIISSEISDEILVSLDDSNAVEGGGGGGGGTSAASVTTWSTGGALHGDNDGDRGNGLRDSSDSVLYDLSSDEEDSPHVLYVDRHNPPSGGGGVGLAGLPGQASRRFLQFVEGPRTRTRPPRFSPPGGSTQEVELLQLFRLKDGGSVLEKQSGFLRLQSSSAYMALSPDNSLLSTTGSEKKMRIWRAFNVRAPQSVVQCDLR